MNKRKAFALSAALLCGLGVAGVVWAMSSASYAIEWDVIGGGGGHAAAGAYELDGTVGQPVVGVVSGGSFELCAGFWCGVQAVEYDIYLPLLLKQHG